MHQSTTCEQTVTIIETAPPRNNYTDDDCDFSYMATPSRPATATTASRTGKRKWNLFRLTELAGMMGVSAQTPRPRAPSDVYGQTHHQDYDHDENKTTFLDDEAMSQPLQSPRIRTALKELNGYSNGLVSPSGASAYGYSCIAPSIISSEDAYSSKSNRGTLYPTVRVRPEYETVYRKNQVDGKMTQNIVCVISVEMPSRRSTREDEGEPSEDDQWMVRASNRALSDESKRDSGGQSESKKFKGRLSGTGRYGKTKEEEVEGFSFGATPSALQVEEPNPFAAVVDDLSRRVIDWKGHTVDRFGPLLLYDFLGVQQDSAVREFYVYLFKEALLCVAEEKKKEKSLNKLTGVDRSSQRGPDVEAQKQAEGSAGTDGSTARKTGLKLKGRIWLRHIKQCEEREGESGVHSLNIKLEDETLDQFVLCFKDQGLRSVWRDRVTELLEDQKRVARSSRKQSMRDMPLPPIPQENNSSQEDQKLLGSNRRRDTDASNSGQSTYSGKAAGYYGPALSPSAQPPSPIGLTFVSPSTSIRYSKSIEKLSESTSGHSLVSPNRLRKDSLLVRMNREQQWSASGGLDPRLPPPDVLPHTPLDLVIMISVPSLTVGDYQENPSSLLTTAALKIQLIRSTLEFVVAHLGSSDRVALVAYTCGAEGSVRRTSLLSTSKLVSREALDTFVETLGKPWDGPGNDPYLEDMARVGGNGDQIDTVTAVNIGFDIVLQRKSKNAVTGMMLITDAAEAPRRGQMDLVMARAEAASVPVHCFGFGKSHDPTSLWLLSNHTRGSYTFIKEWCQLRECITGCIGSMMSIALTQVKLHISVPFDNCFRVRKVAGCTGAIISSDGKNVDLEIGEIRFGDCKELFVEMELDFTTLIQQSQSKRGGTPETQRRKVVSDHYEKGSATDDFVQRLGLQSLNLTPTINTDLPTPSESPDHSIFGEGSFIEEIAVLQVDCACKDPSTGSNIIKLPTPSVLTLEVDGCTPDPLGEIQSAASATALADPIVTRRRLEILVSDMISRCLLLVSRKNQSQALTLLVETRRIVETVLQAIPRGNEKQISPTAPNRQERRIKAPRYSQGKKQKDTLHRKTLQSLIAMLDDLDILIEGLEIYKPLSFDRMERNFGAQQAMALRDQRAWTSRTATEWQFHKRIDNGPAFAALAASQAICERNQSF